MLPNRVDLYGTSNPIRKVAFRGGLNATNLTRPTSGFRDGRRGAPGETGDGRRRTPGETGNVLSRILGEMGPAIVRLRGETGDGLGRGTLPWRTGYSACRRRHSLGLIPHRELNARRKLLSSR